MKENEIITIEQLMDMLNIGKNTAYKLLDSRAIKAFRIGNKWKIPVSPIYEYINEQTECAK
ncbi:MAG: helix-turn-helix domain-containing protein [Ruminococcus sp.]|nr:helix-turn-helix domain-containing protein [Ruminococcus sp.]